MRQMYETEDNLSAEREVVKYLCDKWGAEHAKLPIAYNLDYALFKDTRLRCWIEVKCRNCSMDQYPTYFISAKKIINGLNLAQTTGIPFLLVVKWTDALGFVKIQSGKFDIRIGGRFDRGDWQDVEPMAHFDTQDFAIIK